MSEVQGLDKDLISHEALHLIFKISNQSLVNLARAPGSAETLCFMPIPSLGNHLSLAFLDSLVDGKLIDQARL